MKQNWIAIFGKIETSGDTVTLIPQTQQDVNPQEQAPVTVARSNLLFDSGEITAEMFLTHEDCRCQIGLGGPHGSEIFVGLNVFAAAYGVAILQNGKWEPVAWAGYGDKAPAETWVDVALRVSGSTIELFVSGVKVCTHTAAIQKSALSLLFQGNSPVSVRNFKVKSVKPICFVVMQFTDEFNALYKDVIKPTCEAYGYDVLRGDDFYSSGLIIEDISRSIREAALVIADITPNNANVFYEVGFAHGIGKPTILLSDRKREKLPFDVSGFRTLFYDNTIGGKSAIEENLRKHLSSIAA
jgi:hypothetical protein